MTIGYPSSIGSFSINQIAQSLSETSNQQNSKRPGILHNIKRLAVTAFFILPIIVVRIIAYALSLFGQCGKQAAQKIHQKADKLHAILISHQTLKINLFFDFKIKLLTQAKNIATKTAIWNEHDIKETQKYIALANKMNSISPEIKKKLSTFSIISAKKDGICFGASLLAIKTLKSKKIKAEDQLIKSVKKYKNGFSGEAAGLQNLYEALYNFKLSNHSSAELELIKNNGAKFQEEIVKSSKKAFLEINAMKENELISEQLAIYADEKILNDLIKILMNMYYLFQIE